MEGHTQNSTTHSNLYALLAYIPFLCFIPILNGARDPFALKHGKQGFLLLIVEVIALIFLVPGISGLFWRLVLLLAFLCALYGALRAITGKEFTLPYIGNIFEKYGI